MKQYIAMFAALAALTAQAATTELALKTPGGAVKTYDMIGDGTLRATASSTGIATSSADTTAPTPTMLTP